MALCPGCRETWGADNPPFSFCPSCQSNEAVALNTRVVFSFFQQECHDFVTILYAEPPDDNWVKMMAMDLAHRAKPFLPSYEEPPPPRRTTFKIITC